MNHPIIAALLLCSACQSSTPTVGTETGNALRVAGASPRTGPTLDLAEVEIRSIRVVDDEACAAAPRAIEGAATVDLLSPTGTEVARLEAAPCRVIFEIAALSISGRRADGTPVAVAQDKPVELALDLEAHDPSALLLIFATATDVDAFVRSGRVHADANDDGVLDPDEPQLTQEEEDDDDDDDDDDDADE